LTDHLLVIQPITNIASTDASLVSPPAATKETQEMPTASSEPLGRDDGEVWTNDEG
jgi:hypothetical protein